MHYPPVSPTTVLSMSNYKPTLANKTRAVPALTKTMVHSHHEQDLGQQQHIEFESAITELWRDGKVKKKRKKSKTSIIEDFRFRHRGPRNTGHALCAKPCPRRRMHDGSAKSANTGAFDADAPLTGQHCSTRKKGTFSPLHSPKSKWKIFF